VGAPEAVERDEGWQPQHDHKGRIAQEQEEAADEQDPERGEGREAMLLT
jgi:hypothetical protein